VPASSQKSPDVPPSSATLAAAERALRGPLATKPLLTVFGQKQDPFGYQKRWNAPYPHAGEHVVASGHHFPHERRPRPSSTPCGTSPPDDPPGNSRSRSQVNTRRTPPDHQRQSRMPQTTAADHGRGAASAAVDKSCHPQPPAATALINPVRPACSAATGGSRQNWLIWARRPLSAPDNRAARIRSVRRRSGTPVALSDNCGPRPSREIRRSVHLGDVAASVPTRADMGNLYACTVLGRRPFTRYADGDWGQPSCGQAI
jgi:hypothetical protein